MGSTSRINTSGIHTSGVHTSRLAARTDDGVVWAGSELSREEGLERISSHLHLSLQRGVTLVASRHLELRLELRNFRSHSFSFLGLQI